MPPFEEEGGVQVEKQVSFYAFTPNIAALKDVDQLLIAHRGDGHYGSGFTHLADAWRKPHRAHVYAGDFDAEDLTLALDSGATHLLLPNMAWLTQHAMPLHQPAGQLAYQRRLRQLHVSLAEQLSPAPYLALLEQQWGLLQQWFVGEVECVKLV